MHSFWSSCGRLLEMTISLATVRAPLWSLLVFRQHSFLSWHLRSWMFWASSLSFCPLHKVIPLSSVLWRIPQTWGSNPVSFQDVFRHFFSHNFLCKKVVNIVLIFRWHEWIAVFTEYVSQFPSIFHHSRELPACYFVVLCSFVVVVTAIFCSKFMQ